MATMKVLLATSFLKPFRWCREPKEYTLLIMEFNEAEERTELYWLKVSQRRQFEPHVRVASSIISKAANLSSF
jgi:hypothetical protein